MSTMPPDAHRPDHPAGPPIPPGYQPGEYIPFKDRDPNNPSSIAGQWAHPTPAQAQLGGLSVQETYRAIYGYDAPARMHYASWGRRVLGYLVDTFLGGVASIPLIVGYGQWVDSLQFETDAFGNETLSSTTHVSTATIGLLVIGGLISLAFNVYNMIIRQGRTGYSFGKTLLDMRLVKASTGQPMGAGLCFVRQLAHYVDSLVCYLGWLWPLVDARKQTLADKIMGTVVIVQPQETALSREV